MPDNLDKDSVSRWEKLWDPEGNASKAIEAGSDLLAKPGILKGRRVLVASGSLKSVEGVVVVRSKKGKFAITVSMFSRTVILNMDTIHGPEDPAMINELSKLPVFLLRYR